MGKRMGSLLEMAMAGVVLVGCAGSAVRESQSLVPSDTDPGVIAVVPFHASGADAERELLRYGGFTGYVAAGDVAAQGPETVTTLFRQRLIAHGYSLVSQEIIAEAPSFATRFQENPLAFARRLAREVKADSVLMGEVFRYRERVGNAWGARQPASVAFVALLVRGENGESLWRGRFDETQKPLSEDALDFFSFVRRGGRWLTARELASDGINRVLLTFPGLGRVGVNR
ncbi:MAG: hypothetical protein JRH07_12090 [Deltaproteobacteria bacterium]|nr:hypothetical protein [Deltaproteobacteria bacterium]MBW2122572.1 hypothetical protein [Deltaproteobacteria bacterium]